MALSHEDLKGQLRAAYINKRRRKQPGYHGSENLEKVLDPAAANCVAAGMEPKDYVDALYLQYAVKSTEDKFWPNILSGANALRIAKDYAKNFGDPPFDHMWQTQWQVLKHALIHTKRDVDKLLADDALAFSPWFRVVATKEPVPEVMTRYGRMAKDRLTNQLKADLRRVAPGQLDRIENYERYLPST